MQFSHKLLTNTQDSKICKAFANGSSANIKFSDTQVSEIAQLGGLPFGSPIPIKKIVLANSIKNSFGKELKNTATEKLNDDILVDAGLNMISKKIKRKIS